VTALLRRLSKAGFKRDFVRPAILPDWWDDSLASDRRLVSDIELRVARFLGVSISDVRDPSRDLTVQPSGNTVLRRAGHVEFAKLVPAIHAARRVAEAVVRNLKPSVPDPKDLPKSPDEWRAHLASKASPVMLPQMLRDLWARGIPVIPIARLPAPAFQGLATVIRGRPVIVIGQKHDAPGRVGFFVAHEAGHIANGDCREGEAVVDVEEASSDSSDIELRADRYASRVLIGDANPDDLPDPRLRTGHFQKQATVLANHAFEMEQATGAEAGALLFHWARKHNAYPVASMAVAALYRDGGALLQLNDLLADHIDMEPASDTDSALLGLIAGDVGSATAAD